MNLEHKISQAFHVLHTDYRYLLDHETLGFYYNLMWIESRKLNGNVSFDFICSEMGLSDWKVRTMLKHLLACELVDLVSKDEIKAAAPKRITIEERKIMLEKLKEKGIISEANKDILIKKIESQKEQTKKETVHTHTTADDIDFTKVRHENADSPSMLVDYYYKKLAEVFGGSFASSNKRKEAHLIRRAMLNNNDSPAITRRFFDYLIDDAKRRNKFNEVSGLQLYAKKRNDAFNALVNTGAVHWEPYRKESATKAETDAKVKMLSDINKVYKFHKEKSKTDEDVIRELLGTYHSRYIKKYFDIKDLRNLHPIVDKVKRKIQYEERKKEK